jgi:hypothetical protein
MSATAVREKRQTTIPAEVFDAAGLRVDDQLDWRFEDGELRARKLVPKGRPARFKTKAEVRAAIARSPLKFKQSWEDMRKDTREP